MSDWKPKSYPSVSPYLICRDPERIIDLMAAAFDAVVARRFDRPDGSLMHAELRVDDSLVMIGGGATEHLSSKVHVHVYVPDAQATYDRAIAWGAEPVAPPTRKADDDDLRGGFRDPSGTVWWVATQ
jgi:PhnB protein